MAFFQLVLKARSLEKAKQIYEDEKLRSIAISKGAKPRFTLRQRLRRKKLRCKKKIKHFWNKMTSCPEDSWFHKKNVSLRTDGTLENYLLKSILGFFGGIFLTYIFFVFFVLQLNFALSSATWLCSLIGLILTLGLAFSDQVRCVTFLLLPQFFSKRGRQALMAYAFILALTGPAKNILHNIAVLSESLACGQEQLKEAVKTIIDLVKQPFYALREAISKVIKTVKAVVKKIKETLIAIKRLVLSILRVITSVYQWLGSIVNMCNKKLGTPFDRCEKVFEGAVADCKAKLGPVFGHICNLTYVVSTLCYVVKPYDFICMLVSYVADTVVNAVKKKIKRFTMHVKTMFYVKVKFSHSFHFETNQSRTIQDVSKGIITEIRSRTDAFLSVFDWMGFMTFFFIFFMLLRVMHYRHKWLTNERFDNHYITDDLRTIDLIRTRQKKETVLPLTLRERKKYIPLTSVTLIRVEKTKLAKSAVFLGLATLKLFIYLMVDYSLYWVLSIIHFHGRFETKIQRPDVVGVHVSGDGYLAELYRSIVKAFTPHGKETEIDAVPCLPDPVPPNYDRYTQIVSLIISCWFIAVFEPYGLRLRQVVMCRYYPDRAKQRAAWLYNHIIRSRGSFLKFARRQLRRKFGMTGGEQIEKVTLADRLRATCPCFKILFPQKQNACLLCGAIEQPDKNPHIKCLTPGCIGLFCTQCFADLQNLCTICRSPMEYGDLSDMSEEKDSSDDDIYVTRAKVPPVEKIEPKLEDMKETEVKKEEIEGSDVDRDQKVKITEKDEAAQTEKPIEDESSDSSYSYTYQEESPTETDIYKGRKPFRDVEAQKIRDDVTIQIFNEPFVTESTESSSESQTSGFVIRARRKIRARLKKKEPSDSSTSIADTESWPTEEIDEEEVIHIEVDDDSEELLLKDRKDKKKRGRINRIVKAATKIPWLGKRKSADEIIHRGLQTRRPSLMKKIVSMLRKKPSRTPIQMYRKVRKGRGSTKERILSSSSSSSSLSTYDETQEREVLIKKKDQTTDVKYLMEREAKEKIVKDSDVDTYTICDSCNEAEIENVNLKYPHEKKFITKQLPRFLEPISRDTSYFEVDETEDSRETRKCVRRVEDVNVLSDARTSTESRKADTWNITDENPLCSCTSEITHDTSMNKIIHSAAIDTISEQTDDETKTKSETETEEPSTVSHKDTEVTDETEFTETVQKEQETVKEFQEDYEEPGTSSQFEDSKESTTISESSTEKGTKDTRGMIQRKREVNKEKVHQRNIMQSEEEPGKVEISDPIAGLEIYNDHYKSKERTKPIREDETSKKPIDESKSNDTEEASSKIEHADSKLLDNSQILATSKIDKAIDLPDKSRGTQTKLHKTPKGKNEYTKEQLKEMPFKESKAKKRRRKCFDKGARRKRRHKEKGNELEDKRKYSTSETSILTDYEDELSLVRRKRKKHHHRRNERKNRCEIERRDAHLQTREDYTEERGTQYVPEFRPTSHFDTTENFSGTRDYQIPPYCRQFDNVTEGQRCESEDSIKEDRYVEMNEYPEYPSARYWDERKLCDTCRERCSSNDQSQRYIFPSSSTARLDRRHSGSYKECFQENVPGTSTNYQFKFPRKKFEFPVLKKYLPMYQNPELIEELKEHDRVKLIREREARKRRVSSPTRTTEDYSTCFRLQSDEISCTSLICNPPESVLTKSTEMTLPYQKTEAYKNVTCEFRRRALHLKDDEQLVESIPLITLSKKADKTKDVKQLFSTDDKNRRKFSAASRFTNKIAKTLLPYCSRTQANKSLESHSKCGKAVRQCISSSIYSDSLSAVTPICDCPSERRRSSISTSIDETTDNNESLR